MKKLLLLPFIVLFLSSNYAQTGEIKGTVKVGEEPLWNVAIFVNYAGNLKDILKIDKKEAKSLLQEVIDADGFYKNQAIEKLKSIK